MFKLFGATALAMVLVGGIARAQLPPAVTPPVPSGALITCNIPSGNGYVPNSCAAGQIAALTKNTLTVTTSAGVLTSFGACGGVDDTTALTNWAAAIAAGAVAGIPNSTCVYKSAISFPIGVDGVTVQGVGSQSVLMYAGASTTVAEMLTFGSVTPGAGDGGGCAVNHWALKNFLFASNTVMTAGDAASLGHMCNTDIVNVNVSTGTGPSANSNFYNGMHFWAGNEIHIRGYNYRASNTGLIINGDLSGSTLVDFYLSQGIISHSGMGMDIAGNANPIIDQSTFIDNGTDVSVDQSQVAVTNRGVFFDDSDFIDETSGGAGIGLSITDPGVSTEGITLPGWIAGAANECVYVGPGVNAKITMAGGMVFSCGGDGIQNNSTAAIFSIAGTSIRSNGGYGFDNLASNRFVTLTGIEGQGSNTLADTNGAFETTSNGNGQYLESYTGVGTVFQRLDTTLTSPATLGFDEGWGNNSTGSLFDFTAIQYFARVATAGSEEGEITFSTHHPGGTLPPADFAIDNGAFYLGNYTGTKLIDASGNFFTAGLTATGVVTIPDGTAAAPSLAVGVSNAGLYGDGTNLYGAVAGAEVFEFVAAGPHFTRNGNSVNMSFDRQDATEANGNNIFQILATGFNSTGANLRTWSNILTSARVATTSSEEAELIFQTFHGGALTSDFSIDAGSFYLGAFGTQLINSSGAYVGPGVTLPAASILTIGNPVVENVTPTCSAAGGSPTCVVTSHAGSMTAKLTLGSAGSATTLTYTPGFTATNGFICDAYDLTTTTERMKMTANSATVCTETFYNDAGTPTSPGASDVIWIRADGE